MLNNELKAMREGIASVLVEQCPSSALHAFIDGRDALDLRLHKQAIELGWLAVGLPENLGGFGLGTASMAILHSELGRVAAPGALMATSVALDVLARSEATNDDSVADLIRNVLAGADTLAIEARFSRGVEKAERWLLGNVDATAGLVAGEGEDLLLVDLGSADRSRLVMWDETRSMMAASLQNAAPLAILRDARPAFEAQFALALAADSMGAAFGILDRTIAFMKEREQFGRPIGSFQALKHRVADHYVSAVASEKLVEQALDHIDTTGPGAQLWPLMAKANVTETAVTIAGDCVQLHGGVGYTREYDPHIYLKRVRLNEMLLAPNSVLRDHAATLFRESLYLDVDVLELS